MKVETFVNLSEDLLKAIEETGEDRSSLIESALWDYLSRRVRDVQNARDLQILNENADRLNAEAADVLAYQVAL